MGTVKGKGKGKGKGKKSKAASKVPKMDLDEERAANIMQNAFRKHVQYREKKLAALNPKKKEELSKKAFAEQAANGLLKAVKTKKKKKQLTLEEEAGQKDMAAHTIQNKYKQKHEKLAKEAKAKIL